ncbi:Protein FAM160B2 [Geodia barretti]|uniref:Protein FAM160B2 n=1 Tax=Geodia barretti TaxID=519541 RepID=A0AA35S8G7_GEOBA|nr:Protein FAM160B2 [Geodia barretti]
MFSRFTALVAEVVGFGPQQIRPEDFTTHWRAITDSIATSVVLNARTEIATDAGGSVSETDIPHHLGAMAELLCEEDSQKDSRDHGTMGLCLEFMLRHRILDTLYIPCKNDKLIQLCVSTPRALLALMEIQFLRTIFLKSTTTPALPISSSSTSPSRVPSLPSLSSVSSSPQTMLPIFHPPVLLRSPQRQCSSGGGSARLVNHKTAWWQCVSSYSALINSLLECPLAPVFLRELVFDGSPATTSMTNWRHHLSSSVITNLPNNPNSPHSRLSQGSQTPRLPHSHAFAATTPTAPDSTTTGSSLARQRNNWSTGSIATIPGTCGSPVCRGGDRETVVEDYLIEAHKQILAQSWDQDGGGGGDDRYWRGVVFTRGSNITGCARESLPPPPHTIADRETESWGRTGRGEGPLVPALLSKLERLLDQSYEVNLMLTSVLSQLAAFSHPRIDRLFFPDSSPHNSVFSVLKKVNSELVVHAERSPGFQFNLREVRKRMVGQETSDLLRSYAHNDLLEGAVVLEEFVRYYKIKQLHRPVAMAC